MVIKITKQLTKTSTTSDPFVKLIGEFGRWQLLMFSTASFVKLSTGWILMAIVFLTPHLSYRCVNLPNATVVILNDTCYEGCLQYEYDTSPFDNTIVSEWGLICDRSWMASFTQMMLQLGCLIGSYVFGFLSDRYGRKNTFLLAVSGVIITGLAIPFSPNYIVFTGLRTLLGVATSGIVIVPFVIVMETVGPRYREIAGCLFHIPFIIGHTTLPLFAYYFRTWDQYTLAMAVPPLLYLSLFFTISESPRWLISQGRVDEATRIVTNAAKLNNLPTETIRITLTEMSQNMQKDSNKTNLNYTSLFHKALLFKTICCCILWFIFGVIFYGFNQYIGQTSPDPFISVAFAGAIQVPANISSIWLMKRFGRRLLISIFFSLAGVFMIVLHFVPRIFYICLTLGTLGVSCGGVVGVCIYIYTSELYPTVVRNMGVGLSSLFMRIGSMLAPFIANTAASIPWLPTAVFGGAALLAGFICLLLPEIKSTKLPDNMEDVNYKS